MPSRSSTTDPLAKANFVYGLLLALLSPALVLLMMIKGSRFANPRLLLTVLVVIFGLTLPITEAADGFRHQQMVIDEYIGMSWELFFEDFRKILTFDESSSSKDLYKHLVSFISGGILQTPSSFFLIVSLVYGYFYSGVILELFRRFHLGDSYKGLLFWIFASIFFLNKGMEGVQTVRTWTGLWILFYAVLMYEKTQRTKYLILLFLPPLVHLGYFVMAIPAYLVFLLGNRHRLLGVLFVFTSFTNVLTLETFSAYAPSIGILEEKLNAYGRTDEELTGEAKLDKLDKKRGNVDRTWYKKLDVSGYNTWPKKLLICLLLVFGIPAKYMNKLEQRLYSVGVATLVGANLLYFIIAITNRMQIIGLSFVLGALIMLMLRNGRFADFVDTHLVFRVAIGVFCVMMIPQFIYWLSFFLSQTSTFYVAFPLYPLLFEDGNIPLIDAIKWAIGYS